MSVYTISTLTFTTKFLASCKSLSLSSFSRSGYSIWLKARDKASILCAFHSCTRWLNSSYRNTMSNTLKTFGSKGKFCFFSPRNEAHSTSLLFMPLPPFSLIRDFGKQNTHGNVSKISVSLRVIDRSDRNAPITAQ